MTRILLLTILIFSANSAFSQSIDQQRQDLQKQISGNLAQSRVDLVIEPATRLAELEKSLGDGNIENYAMALSNLLLWKKSLYSSTDSTDPAPQKPAIYQTKIQSELRQGFLELVQIFRVKINDPSRLSSALLESGAFQCSFPDPAEDPLTLPAQLRESVSIREKTVAPDSNPMINALTLLSQCEFAAGDFNGFFGTNKRLIAAIESRFGKDSPRLLSPLGRLEQLLILTDRAAEATEVVNRISAIAGTVYQVSSPNEMILKMVEGRIRRSYGERSGASIENRTVSVPDPTAATRNDRAIVTATQTGVSVVTVPGSQTTTRQIVTESSRRIYVGQIVSIPVTIKVDENGVVVEATAEIANKGLKKKAESAARDWKFKPMVIDGVPYRMIGRVFINWRT